MADEDLKKFHSLLVRLEGGALNEELSDLVQKACQELADACNDRGGEHTASINLTIKFKMNQKDKILEVTADVKDKMPTAPARGRAGMFYIGSDGFPCRENPRQLTLDDELKRKREEREEALAAKA